VRCNVSSYCRFVVFKTIAGMQWASENLPNNTFYSSGDDDFYLNFKKLLYTVNETLHFAESKNWKSYPIICFHKTALNAKPHREKESKWFIDENEYKETTFPPYCLGGFYTTRADTVRRLYDAAKKVPYMRFDDVWITGTLRQLVNMTDDMLITPSRGIVVHKLGKTVSSSVLDHTWLMNYLCNCLVF